MALSSEHSSSLRSVSYIPDDKIETLADEAVDPAPVDTEVTYPEAGRDAWLVVLGA